MKIKKAIKGQRLLYYLASPYSHAETLVRVMRYELIVAIAADLIKEGYNLIEPIAMCHEKSDRYQLKGSYEFWQNRDRDFIRRSDGVIVVTLPGWDQSIGVIDEIAYAKALGRPVHYYNPKKYLDILKPIIEDKNAIY